MKILLDTCTFLWIASGSKKLSRAAEREFLDLNNEIYLSAASAWEIAIKHAAGRLSLPGKPETYIAKLRNKSGIESLAIEEGAAAQMGRLPKLHSDPFDRMLVAQAVVHGMTILTPDEAIAQYAARVIW